jgi:hypothetical protein
MADQQYGLVVPPAEYAFLGKPDRLLESAAWIANIVLTWVPM